MAQFFWIPYEGPIFLTSWYMHIFFAQRFFEAAYPLGITWISDPSIWWVRAWIGCDICETTSKNGYKKIKGQFMNRLTFWMIKYMNGSVFSKARYMNGVGFEILARTPVPKLPLSYRPPPHPHPPQELKSRHSERCEAVFFKNFSVTIYRPFFFFFFFLFFFFFFFFFFKILFMNFFMYFIVLLSFIFYYVSSLVLHIIFFFLSFFFLSYIFFIH